MNDKIKINLNILRYRYSEVMGELINVGVLIYYSNKRSFSFLTLSNFDKLHYLYTNFSESILKQQMFFIKDKFENSKSLRPYGLVNKLNVSEFIENEILPKDATQLQFGEDITLFYPKDYFRIGEFEENIVKTYLQTSVNNIHVNEIVANQSDLEKSLNLWIVPDYKNKITKIPKDYIYLPSKRKL